MNDPQFGVVFDVNETLFSLDRIGTAFRDAGLDPALVPVWFAGVLRDGFALTALGEFRPFAEVAVEVLRGLDDRVDERAATTVVPAEFRRDVGTLLPLQGVKHVLNVLVLVGSGCERVQDQRADDRD